jgi:NTE family protein
MRIHRISSADIMTALGASSKLNAEWAFLCMLRDERAGAAPDEFLEIAMRDRPRTIGCLRRASKLDIDELLRGAGRY